MSLHKFADMVASKGRGDDSLLIHMTPDEVRNLQKFAEANGTTLTINPDTGLPEAGMLSDLFKAVAPIALGAFLGPGAFGIAGLGMSAGTAGLVTGGLTTLATGSLSRGLMAGLGAYGGAGLAEGLMGAGVGAAQQSAMGSLSADQIAAEMAQGAFSFDGSGLTQQGVLNQAAADATKSAMANTGQAVSSGFNAVTATPSAMGTFAKQNLGNIAAAAAPIMAGQMVPTTTKMPENTNPAYIRQKLYDPYTQTYKSLAPVKASEFGSRNFSDAYTNPQTGQMATLDQRQPMPMAGGGIVALAAGGDYRSLTKDSSADDIASAYKQFTTASGGDTAANQKAAIDYLTNLGIGQDKIGQAYGTYQASPTYTDYTQQNVTDYLTTNKDINIAEKTKELNANPFLVNQAINQLALGYLEPSQTTAGSGAQKYYDAYTNRGITADELYAANLALNPNYAFDAQTGKAGIAALNRAFNVAKQFDTYEYDKAPGTQLEKDVAFLKQYDAGKFTGDRAQQIEDIARETGLSLNDAARRYDAARAAMKPITTVTGGTGVTGVTGGTGGTGTGGTGIGGTGGVSNGVIPGGFYGNATNPGDITTNKDGTVTVHPNIPYRPYGGFSGMGEVRDAYTKGGGSLGYTSPVVKTAAEHAAAYNTMTDDSLDAYNFLMGKGKNLTQRKAETRNRPVSQRYDEAVMGRKIGKPVVKTTETKLVTGIPGQPQTYFNEAEYLAANPDVAAELKSGKSNFTSAYEHWLRYGKAEGRKFMGDYEGYTTALALASAAGAGGGGDGPTGPSGGGNPNSISGFTPGLANPNISDVNMSTMSPAAAAAAAASAADSAAAAAASATGNAPGSDGSPGSGAKNGGMIGYAMGGGLGSLGSYSDGGRLLRGPGDGVSDSIPATIGRKQQPARLADGEFVIPARIVSELGNGSTDAGAKKLYAMMDRVQRARGKTTGKNKVAANSRADKYLPA